MVKLKLEGISKMKQENNDNNVVFGVMSIVFDIIGFFILGIVFESLGFAFGAIGLGMNKKDTVSLIGMIIGVIGLIMCLPLLFSR
jgi:hypothetical protein